MESKLMSKAIQIKQWKVEPLCFLKIILKKNTHIIFCLE